MSPFHADFFSISDVIFWKRKPKIVLCCIIADILSQSIINRKSLEKKTL